ncbi:uncharacterized protein LOC134677650 [Cydia fagiglandana]|uniref:uncharacterized protein LOC134677650 n=1 Tax=Cydia fagiglandana TaxID=1458189 RepID=UPI002FEE0E30
MTSSLVLALGLDTGVVETKNSFVESISRAFSGLTQSQHSRSNKGETALYSVPLTPASLRPRTASWSPSRRPSARPAHTGVVETKNSFVESISKAFSGLTQSRHSRSNTDDKKLKPLALELRSDAILHGVENFLASPKVKKFTNDMARKAAVMYRAIEKVFS